MAWCPKCKNEYREGIRVCAECGCELVEEGELISYTPLVFGDEQQMLSLKEFLKYNKIEEAQIRYDEADAVYELLVRDGDLQQAQKLSRVFMEQQAMTQPEKAQEYAMDKEGKEAVEEMDSEAGESAEEDTQLLEAASPYVNSAQQAEDNRSSAWTLLVVGGVGIIVVILGIVGILPLNLSNPYLFYGVMSAVFLLFIVMGAVSMKNAKIFAKKAESENFLRESLLKWSASNLTAEKIDEQIENAGELSEEVLYFKRYEVIRKMMNHQFMNLDQRLLEKLIDDEVYDMVFEEEEA